MKIQIFPQNSSKICIFKIFINYKKKSNGPNFFFLNFFILLDLFYDCANFRVNRSISCRDLRGGQISPPPPPMDSSPRNNPMGIGLKQAIGPFSLQKIATWKLAMLHTACPHYSENSRCQLWRKNREVSGRTAHAQFTRSTTVRYIQFYWRRRRCRYTV